jgi:hypothetical protein
MSDNVAWPLTPERQRCCLVNAINMMTKRHKRSVPLWSLVGEITGHGSGYSILICVANKWNPNQQCNNKGDFVL